MVDYFFPVISSTLLAVLGHHTFLSTANNVQQAFTDIRLRPGIATSFMAVAARCSLHLSASRPLRPNVTSFINRKYITYRNVARGGPSHGHRGSTHKISWRSVQRFQRYACRQTDKHTDRRVDHNTPHNFVLCFWSDNLRGLLHHASNADSFLFSNSRIYFFLSFFLSFCKMSQIEQSCRCFASLVDCLID